MDFFLQIIRRFWTDAAYRLENMVIFIFVFEAYFLVFVSACLMKGAVREGQTQVCGKRGSTSTVYTSNCRPF